MNLPKKVVVYLRNFVVYLRKIFEYCTYSFDNSIFVILLNQNFLVYSITLKLTKIC